MHLSLASKLLEFTDAHSPAQLEQLQRTVDEALAKPMGQSEVSALLGVFERFPEDDGYGIFWSILHGLEQGAGYETELVRSVMSAPNLFNTLMLNRILNSGVATIHEHSIRELLVAAEREPSRPTKAAKQLRSLLAHPSEAQ
jgi:hypothetical protein